MRISSIRRRPLSLGSLLLTPVLAFTGLLMASAPSSAAPVCSANVRVNGQWWVVVDVTLTNVGDLPSPGWRAEVALRTPLTSYSVWGAAADGVLPDVDGSATYVFTEAGWNGQVPPNGAAGFGFYGFLTQPMKDPFLGASCTMTEAHYTPPPTPPTVVTTTTTTRS
ncbi:MAG: hypothetical protein GXX79_07440 [Actinomycetales bacterium]|nr:hypothetical protein [Actinomycetales bacterium]